MPNRTFFSNDDIVNGKLCVSDNQNDIYNLTYRFLYTNHSTSQDHYAIVAEASGSCLSVKFVDAVMPQETRFINYSERCSESGLCFFVLDEDNFDLYFDTISNCISSGYEISVVTSVSGIALSGEPILTILEPSSDPSTPGLSSSLGWYEFNSGILNTLSSDISGNILSTGDMISPCSTSTDHTLSLFFNYTNLTNENHRLLLYKDGDCSQTDAASGCSEIVDEVTALPSSLNLLDPATIPIDLGNSISNIQLNFNNSVTNFDDSNLNSLFVSGNFTQINGESYRNLAQIIIDPENIAINESIDVGDLLPPNILTDGNINTIAVDPNTDAVYIGGTFTKFFKDGNKLFYIDNNDDIVPIITSFTGSDIRVAKFDELNGLLIVGGRFTEINGQNRTNFAIIDINDNSILSTPPIGGNFNDVYALDFDSDNVYIGGSFIGGNFTILDRNTNNLNTNFSSVGIVRDIKIDQTTNLLHIVGSFTNFNDGITSETRYGYAILDKNNAFQFITQTHPGFRSGSFSAAVQCIELDHNNNRVYIGGNFNRLTDSASSTSPFEDRFRFVALDKTTYLHIADTIYGFSGDVNDIKYDPVNNNIYVGGGFFSYYPSNTTTSGSVSRQRFLGFSADSSLSFAINTNLPTFGSNVLNVDYNSVNDALNITYSNTYSLYNATNGTLIDQKTVDTIIYGALFANSGVYVYGLFSEIDPINRGRFAQIINGEVTSLNVSFNSTVDNIRVDSDSNKFIVGDFTSPNSYFTVLDSSNSNITNTSDFSPTNRVREIEVSDDNVYVSGDIGSVSISDTRLVNLESSRYRNNLFSNLVVNNGRIHTIEYNPDQNYYYIGGDFTQINSVTRNRFAIIDQNGNLIDNSPGTNPSFTNDKVYKIKYYPTIQRVIVSGDFSLSDYSETIRGLAILDSNTYNLIDYSSSGGHPAINSGIIWDFDVNLNENILYVGGSFTQIKGQTRNRFAGINLVNGEVIDFFTEYQQENLSFNQQTRSIEVDTDNEKVYIGGDFTNIGVDIGKIASYDTSGNRVEFPVQVTSTGFFDRIEDFIENTNYMFFGGRFTSVNGISRNGLAVYNKNTEEIEDFSVNPDFETNRFIFTMEKDPINENLIYFGGDFISPGQRFVSIDFSTNPPTVSNTSFNFNNTVRTIKVYDDSIFVGGDFTERFITLDRNSLDVKSFGPSGGEDPGFNNTVWDIEINENNKDLYIGGQFTQEVKFVDRYARLDGDGNIIPTLPSFNSNIEDAIEVGDYYYVVGNFTSVNGLTRHRIAAFDKNTGEIVKTNIGVNSIVNSLDYDSSENLLYIGGQFTSKYLTTNRIASFDKNTKSIKTVDLTINGEVLTATHQNGKTYIGGSFTQINGQIRNRFAVIDNNGNLLSETLDFNSTVEVIKSDVNNLYIGGAFTQINGVSTFRFAILDINTLENKEYIDLFETETVPGFNSTVRDLVIDYSTERILLVGIFSVYYPSNRTTDNSDSSINRFCVIDKNDGSLVSTNFPSLGFSTLYTIDLDNNNNRAYVGGTFTATNISRLLVVDSYTYTSITEISGNDIPQFNSTVWEVSYDSTSDEIYIGGDFTDISNLPESRTRFASFNASDFSLINYTENPSFDSSVRSITRDGSKIYVGGNFTNSFVILESDGSIDDNETFRPNSTVNDILIVSDDIYAVGNFSQSNLESTGRFETIDTNENTFTNLLSPSFNGTILDIKIDDINNDKILVGGFFTTVDDISGSNSRNRFAALNKDGTLRQEDLNFNNTVYSFETDTDNNRIYIGGRFSEVGDTPVTRYKFAAFDSNLNLIDFETIPGGTNPSIHPTSSTRQPRVIKYQDGRIFLGGLFNEVNGETRDNFAELQIDGNIVNHPINPSFSSTINDIVYTLNNIYIGGNFTSVNGDSDVERISKFNSTDLTLEKFSSNYKLSSSVNKIIYDNNNLDIFGLFTQYRVDLERFAIFDLDTYSLSFEPSRPEISSGVVRDMKFNSYRNELYIGGTFTGQVNGENREYLSAFSVDITGGFSLLDYGYDPLNSDVYTIESSGDVLFAGGINGEFIYLDLNDGSLINTSDEFLINDDLNVIRLMSDNNLLVGGRFTQLYQNPANRFVALSKFLEYQPFSINDYPSFNNSVIDIKIDYSNDRIYACGSFTNPTSRISYIDKNTGEFGPSGPSINLTVNSLDLTPSKVIIGGDFSSPRERFAILDKDTLQIDDIDIRFISTVQDVFYDSIDSNILVGGSFSSYQYDENNITQIDRNTLQVSENFEIINGNVNVLKYDYTNDILFAGGDFESLDFISSENFAVISGSATVLSSNYQIDSTVTALDLDEINEVIYIGGNSSFSIAPSGGNLISLDYDGNFLSEASVNGSINFLSTSESNKILFVGGSFTEVNGEFINNFAMFGDYEVNPESYYLLGRNENGNLNFIILSETNYDAFVTNNCIACSATVTSATSSISRKMFSVSGTENIFLEDALVEIGEEGVITPINDTTDDIGKLYLDIEDINFPDTGGGGGGGGAGPEDNNNCCGQPICAEILDVGYCPKPYITVGFITDDAELNIAQINFDSDGQFDFSVSGKTATFTWEDSIPDSSVDITVTYTNGCIDGESDIVIQTTVESVKETTVTNANVTRTSIVDGVGCEFVVTISVGYDPRLEDDIPNSLEQFRFGNTFWRLCNPDTNSCSLGGLLGGFTRVGNTQISGDGLLIVDYEFTHSTNCTDRVIRYDDIQLFLFCVDGLTVISDLSEQSCPCCTEAQP